MSRYVLCAVLCVVLLPACGEDAAPGSTLPVGEGEGAEGEGPVVEGEGEGEGPIDGEGEGEGPVCACFSDADCQDGNFCNGAETCDCTCSPGVPPACVDEFECTEDRCANNACVNVPAHARCGAGKICKPDAGGCVAAPACQDDAGCVSEDPCTAGVCEPATRACVFAPLDGDHDGHQPRVCGGDDCDDGNPLVFPGAEELCNGADDNCDGNVDEGFTLRADPANCGSCGNRCSFFLVCREGQCQCEEEGFSPCNADQCNQEGFSCEDGCFNLQTDFNNCGGCGNFCEDLALTCRGGECRCPNEGETLCEDEFDRGFSCVNVQNNLEHCGQCGNECGGDEDCVEGGCRGPECAPGEQLCQWQDDEGAGVSCVDTMNNFWNCGGCDNRCDEGEECQLGQCFNPNVPACELDERTRRNAGACPGDQPVAPPGDINVVGTAVNFRTTELITAEDRLRLNLYRPMARPFSNERVDYGFAAPCDGGAFTFFETSVDSSPTVIVSDDFDCDGTDNWITTTSTIFPVNSIIRSVRDAAAWCIASVDVDQWNATLRQKTGDENLNLTADPNGTGGCLTGHIYDDRGQMYAGASVTRGPVAPPGTFYFNDDMTDFSDGAATTSSGAFLVMTANLDSYSATDPSGRFQYQRVLTRGGANGSCVVIKLNPNIP